MLSKKRAVLGESHHDTLGTMNKLAEVTSKPVMMMMMMMMMLSIDRNA